MTRLARHIDVGQEVHLDLDKSVAGAGFTPPALDVEAEAPWLIAARLAFEQPREPVADDCEGAGVGRGVGSRGAAERGLNSEERRGGKEGVSQCRFGGWPNH